MKARLLPHASIVTTLTVLSTVLCAPHGSAHVYGQKQQERSGANPALAQPAPHLGRLPVPFVPNAGQWSGEPSYVARFGPMTVFLERDGWTFTLEDRGEQREPRRGVAVAMRFDRAGPATLVPRQRLPGVHHYYLGADPSKWRRDVPLYDGVLYRGVYDGIDVVTREHAGHFEYDLLLRPEADLAQVEMTVEGASGLRLDLQGALVIETALGPVRMKAPPSWEEGPSGEKCTIACRYVLLGHNRFGFAAPARRPGWSLVVDPGLEWATYLGGSGFENPTAVAIDPQGVIVSGSTQSTDFPPQTGTLYGKLLGTQDAFVSKLSPDGKSLIWSAYLGGTGREDAWDLSSDALQIIVVGGTDSTDFPTTAGAFQGNLKGTVDGFIATLSPIGDKLVYSTYFGGSSIDSIVGVAHNVAGDVTVIGSTDSADLYTRNPYQGALAGDVDVFVTRFSSIWSPVYSTYFGGPDRDNATAIAVERQGSATFTGHTFSTTGIAKQGMAFDETYNGNNDAFVAKLSPSGSTLVYGTYLGGSNAERAMDIALDPRGAATVMGWVHPANHFPTTAGAYQRSHGNGSSGSGTDIFVTRFSTDGLSLEWSTFLGGSGNDLGERLHVDPRGVTTVVGGTTGNFPTTLGAWDRTYGDNGVSNQDAFVSQLSTDGSSLIYSTYFGARTPQRARAVAVDGTGAAVVLGHTGSNPSYPISTSGVFQPTPGGRGDAFVARFSLLPSGVERYGISTLACQGPIAMGVTRMPRSGDAKFALTCGAAPPNSTGFLVVGSGPHRTGIPFLGIRLHLDLAMPIVNLGPSLSNDIGAVRTPIPLPTGINGVRGYLQYLWLNTTACGGSGTVSASNALDLTVQ